MNEPISSGPMLMKNLSDRFYRLIWDVLQSPMKTKKGKKGSGAVVVVSSCNRREGASTIALNIASAFSANSLKKVVLIDGNIRNPVLHHFFGIAREPGLTDLVNGDAGTEEAVFEIMAHRLHFISAGRLVDNPVLFFEGLAFVEVIERLRSLYDLIIFDSSPVIPYPETPILANVTDGLILILEAESTRWEVGLAAKNNLEKANVNILGAILNKKEFYIPRSVYKFL